LLQVSWGDGGWWARMLKGADIYLKERSLRGNAVSAESTLGWLRAG
jgi:hypothetical protein